MTTMPKTVCPMTAEQFLATAPTLTACLGEGRKGSLAALYVAPRGFSTGSVGLYGGDKVRLDVGAHRSVVVQVGATITAIGSKAMSTEQKGKLLAALKPLMLTFHGDAVQGEDVVDAEGESGKARLFSSGGFGWNWNSKLSLDGQEFQVGINAVIVGSKDAARGNVPVQAGGVKTTAEHDAQEAARVAKLKSDAIAKAESDKREALARAEAQRVAREADEAKAKAKLEADAAQARKDHAEGQRQVEAKHAAVKAEASNEDAVAKLQALVATLQAQLQAQAAPKAKRPTKAEREAAARAKSDAAAADAIRNAGKQGQ